MANKINSHNIEIEVRRDKQCNATPPYKLARMIHLLLRLGEVPEGSYVYNALGPTVAPYDERGLWGELTPNSLEPHYGKLVLKHGELPRESFTGILHLSRKVGPEPKKLWEQLMAAVATFNGAGWIENNLKTRSTESKPTQTLPTPSVARQKPVQESQQQPAVSVKAQLLAQANPRFQIACSYATLRKELLVFRDETRKTIADYVTARESLLRAKKRRSTTNGEPSKAELATNERVEKQINIFIAQLEAEVAVAEREIHSVTAEIQRLQRSFTKVEEIEFLKHG